ncbi:MAG: hypothetical protein QXM16_07840 [Nitrososphaerota archaeon]
MSSKGIYIKGIDRRLKALAAEKGTHVYKLLNEAISNYLATYSSKTYRGNVEARRR